MPFFSIIIPVYNVEKYLRYCMESILSQQFTDYEVILVDDGSTDKSGGMCDEYAAQDSRVRAIHQQNKGLGGARNTGILNAQGEWILFLDSDDSMPKSTLENWKASMSQNKQAEVIAARFMFQDKDNNVYYDEKAFKRQFVSGKCETQALQEAIKRYDESSGWAVWKLGVKRQTILEKQVFFKEDIRHAEDLYWIFKLFMSVEDIYFEDIYVCVYRINRDGNLSGNTFGMMQGVLDTIKCFEKEFGDGELTENQRFVLAFLTNMFFYNVIRTQNLPAEQAKARKKMVNDNRYIARYIDKSISSKNQRIFIMILSITGVYTADMVINVFKGKPNK
ncbi:MAG: glycosyltransferase family A protein [Oscillospiraceae bacterium]